MWLEAYSDGEKFGGAINVRPFGLWYVKTIAAVMFEGRSEIPCLLTVGCSIGSGVGVFEDEITGSGWGKGRLVEIKDAVELRMGRELGVNTGCAEEVESDHSLRQ
jgi:hypothetical protein